MDYQQQLRETRNKHWRNVAHFDRDVMPVVLHLENVDWAKLLSQYKARWTPEQLAEYEQSVELHKQMQLFQFDERRAEAIDDREFLATELRTAARVLGKYHTQHYGNVRGVWAEEKWEARWVLQQVLTLHGGKYGPAGPYTVGEEQAWVTVFWKAYHAFLQAEKDSSPLTPEQEAEALMYQPGPEVLTATPPPAVAEPFAVAYRRAIRELQRAHRMQVNTLPDTVEDDLHALAHQQYTAVEAAILSNAQTGRGLLVKSLREAMEAQKEGWDISQWIKQQIDNKTRTTDKADAIPVEKCGALYYVVEDALGGLLDLFGTYFPAELPTSAIATYAQSHPLPDLVQRFGSPHLKRVFTSHAATRATAKRSVVDDVRRYFPDLAEMLGKHPTERSALGDLGRWLLHWEVQHGHRADFDPYSLSGVLRRQLEAQPNPKKFLKACERLHAAMLPLTSTPEDTKALLQTTSEQTHNDLRAVLKLWARWIREQISRTENAAAAYVKALRRIQVIEDWQSGSPVYTLPVALLDYDGFDEDVRPLREAFEAVLPRLAIDEKRALRAQLLKLLNINSEGLKDRRKWHEENRYFPANLPADYPALLFDVESQTGVLSHAKQNVSVLFWPGLLSLMQFKQAAAREAYNTLNAALGEPAAPTPPAKTEAPAAVETPSGEDAQIEPDSPLATVLLNYSEEELRWLLTQLGLLTADNKPGKAATPGAWVGVIYALLESTPPRLKRNHAAIARAFTHAFGHPLKSRTVQNGLGKTGGEAHRFRDDALSLLKQ